MALVPQFLFPSYFTIRSTETKTGILLSFSSPLGNLERELEESPSLSDLLQVIPEFTPPRLVLAFSKSIRLPRMFEFKAAPMDEKARVMFTVFHPTKEPKTWSRDFDAPRISMDDLVAFKDLLSEGVAYQKTS